MKDVLIRAIANDSVTDDIIKIYLVQYLKNYRQEDIILLSNRLRAKRPAIHEQFFTPSGELTQPVISSQKNTVITLPAEHPGRINRLLTEYTRLSEHIRKEGSHKASEQMTITRHFVAIAEELLSHGTIESTQSLGRKLTKYPWYYAGSFGQACHIIVELLEKGNTSCFLTLPDL